MGNYLKEGDGEMSILRVILNHQYKSGFSLDIDFSIKNVLVSGNLCKIHLLKKEHSLSLTSRSGNYIGFAAIPIKLFEIILTTNRDFF